MKKTLVLAFLFLATAGASSPLSLRIELKRSSLDLLDPIPIVISVVNNTKGTVTATFASAQLYDIRIASAKGAELWRWSATHMSAQVLRTQDFAPGKTILATYVWDGTLADGRSLGPGTYTLRVWLVDRKYHPSAEMPIRLATPLPVHAALALPLNTAATIAGPLRTKANVFELADSSGAIELSKRMGRSPQGVFIVRGYLTKANGNVLFTVDRWAPAFDNVAQSGVPDWLEGNFGGRHISMRIDGTQGTIQFECAHASVAEVSPAGDSSAFATGLLFKEHGGSTRIGEILPSSPVRYTFGRTASGITLTVMTQTPGPNILGTYTLAKNAFPQLLRCL